MRWVYPLVAIALATTQASAQPPDPPSPPEPPAGPAPEPPSAPPAAAEETPPTGQEPEDPGPSKSADPTTPAPPLPPDVEEQPPPPEVDSEPVPPEDERAVGTPEADAAPTPSAEPDTSGDVRCQCPEPIDGTDQSPYTRGSLRRTHDGFYLRLGFGIGYARDSFSSNNSPEFFGSVDGTVQGATTGLEFAIGGTFGRGVVVGGGFYVEGIWTPQALDVSDDVIQGGDVEFDSTSAGIVGPFIDWYFDPTGGFHAQAAAGLGFVKTSSSTENSAGLVRSHSASGTGFIVGVGHDWWVNDEWSLGVLGRAMFVFARGNETDGEASWKHRAIVAPTLLFVSTYH